jgi:glycosyltransferase involved in cell wall biosynthesis
MTNIHIISFNIPYPPNYGGIIDVYYKIKALHDKGINVILHCFDYGRGETSELEKVCNKIYYYKRTTGVIKSLGRLPYIVNSRSNTELLENLIKDNYPILFEGLHTTFFLNNKKLNNRVKIVRTHNIEYDYYNFLYQQEKNILKKLYYKNAAKKLKNYESVLKHANFIAAISPNDFKYFSAKYKNVFWLPPFHPNNKVNIEFGTGSFVLYHGNLSVAENIKAVIFLINSFKNEKTIKLVIAGKNPSKKLYRLVKNMSNITIVANPLNKEMLNLIKNAHIHLLPTFQPTGIKLKLISSLFNGRHIIANSHMVDNTGLETMCHVVNTENEFVAKTVKLLSMPFENKDLIIRKEILDKKFNNTRNIELLLTSIY